MKFPDDINSAELKSIAEKIVDNVSVSPAGQAVVNMYGTPFTVPETSVIILAYMEYAMVTGKAITTFNESSFLDNEFYRYIVKKMTGNINYTFEKKGLRDRIWNVLSELAKIGGKYYQPFNFFTADNGAVGPANEKKGLYTVLGIVAALGITKYLKMW